MHIVLHVHARWDCFLLPGSIYLVHVVGGSNLLWGVTVALASIAGAAAITPTGITSDRIGRKPIIRTGLVASVVLLTSIVFSKDPAAISVLVAMVLVASYAPLPIIICTTITTIITDVTAEWERGKGIDQLVLVARTHIEFEQYQALNEIRYDWHLTFPLC